MKTPLLTLLDFEKTYKRIERVHDYVMRSLSISRIASDTHLRDVMNEINRNDFRPVFKKLFTLVRESKILKKFNFIEVNGKPYYLISVDGTGYFSSKKVHCDNCITYHEDDDDYILNNGKPILSG